MNIATLNEQFGRAEQIVFSEGRNGLAKATLRHRSGSQAEIYLYGAHVTSWKNARGEELFFLSSRSWFEPGKPIRGGIPVIFPQFGPGALPLHGLVRLQTWEVVRAEAPAEGPVTLTLGVESNDETLAQWPSRYRVEYTVTLDDTLVVRMAVRNCDEKSFRFQAALHTYFAITDIARATLEGLGGLPYLDSLRDRARDTDMRRSIPLTGGISRIYGEAPDAVRLVDHAAGRTFEIRKEYLTDMVTWNPWIERCREFPDMADDDYLRMFCVETGTILTPVELRAGEQWTGSTQFIVV